MASGDVNGFWGGYEAAVRKAGIPDERVRWHVYWAHKFAASIRGVPLRARCLADIRAFLDRLKRREDIAPWQYEQAREALQVLYRDHLGIALNAIPAERAGGAAPRPRDARADGGRPDPRHSALLDRLRREIRTRHYSARTGSAYAAWAARFLAFHDQRPPQEIGPAGIHAYLSYLAEERNVSASTQNQALNAIVFLYTQVLGLDPGEFDGFVRAKRPRRVPASLTREQVSALLSHLDGDCHLMAALMYGSGLRLSECLRLRVKHIDLDRRQIRVADGKGQKDRMTPLPDIFAEPVREQFTRARQVFDEDSRYGQTDGEWPDQHLFPARRLSVDPATRRVQRPHFSKETLQLRVKHAARQAGLDKSVTCHTLRHSFAAHLVQDGCHIQTVQELLGHARRSTTLLYAHPMNRPGPPVRSPADHLTLRARGPAQPEIPGKGEGV
ncbi:MAG: integron integrase [Kiritimatiellae bacterium]|nr:integron integrase [Kiritimatiellia bacterium]